MANETAKKTLKTRIKLKRDTSANWEKANPVLLNGETIIVDTANNETRTKTGDGTKTYTQLPFDDEGTKGGKGLSTNDYTTEDKAKVGSISSMDEKLSTLMNKIPVDYLTPTNGEGCLKVSMDGEDVSSHFASINLEHGFQYFYYYGEASMYGVNVTGKDLTVDGVTYDEITYGEVETKKVGCKYTDTDNVVLETHRLTEKANTSDVLTKTNTTEFTPTSDYHPATKKYVDDFIKCAFMMEYEINDSDGGTISDSDEQPILGRVDARVNVIDAVLKLEKKVERLEEAVGELKK